MLCGKLRHGPDNNTLTLRDGWLPTGWTMDGIHKLVSFGYGPESIVFNVAALLAAAGVFSLLAARSFRFA